MKKVFQSMKKYIKKGHNIIIPSYIGLLLIITLSISLPVMPEMRSEQLPYKNMLDLTLEEIMKAQVDPFEQTERIRILREVLDVIENQNDHPKTTVDSA